MKTFNKSIVVALCVGLFVTVFLVTAQAARDPEVEQILAAAKRYVDSYNDSLHLPKYHGEARADFVFRKKVKNCAEVWLVPKPKYANQLEGASIILKKIGGKWVGQFMGTHLGSMKEICPELFK
jgi:hypothetical protein